MTISKITLTKEQADALEYYKTQTTNAVIAPVANFIENHLDFSGSGYAPLKDFPIDQFARLIYEPNSYEVIEPQLKVGKWVKRTDGSSKYRGKIIKITGDGTQVWAYWDDNNNAGWIPMDELELMTSEEIKV